MPVDEVIGLEKLKNLTKKQKSFLLLGLGLLLILTFVVSSSFAEEKTSQKKKAPALGTQEEPAQAPGNITKFSISSEKDSLAPGEQMQFTAFIEGDGNYDDTVAWSIQGDHHPKTVIGPDGKLTVDLEETASQLIIRGTCGGGAYASDKPISIVKPSPSPAPAPSSTTSSSHERIVAPGPLPQDVPASPQAQPGQEGQVPGGDQKENPPVEKPQANIQVTVENMAQVKEKLKDVKEISLPDTDLVLKGENLEIQEGETALAFIQRILKEANLEVQVDSKVEPGQEKILGINDLKEKDLGDKIAWQVYLNGQPMKEPINQYRLKDQDKLEIIYGLPREEK